MRGKGTILNREADLYAASESVSNFFIRNAEQIFFVTRLLGNCEVAGEEKKRPEVFRLMTTNIGMVEFVVDPELPAVYYSRDFGRSVSDLKRS